MEDDKTIIGYHATDKKYCSDIINNGFKCSHNDNHWLGNGYYFFYDRELANWWATNPTSKFGEIIEEKAIIEVQINASRNKMINLLSIEDYNNINSLFLEFMSDVWKTNSKVLFKPETIRCSFFDWINSEFECEVIIAGFIKNENDNNNYLKINGELSIQNKIELFFYEIQICVFHNRNIVNKKIL